MKLFQSDSNFFQNGSNIVQSYLKSDKNDSNFLKWTKTFPKWLKKKSSKWLKIYKNDSKCFQSHSEYDKFSKTGIFVIKSGHSPLFMWIHWGLKIWQNDKKRFKIGLKNCPKWLKLWQKWQFSKMTENISKAIQNSPNYLHFFFTKDP